MKIMKSKIAEVIIAPFSGILAVIFLLLTYNIIVYRGDIFSQPDDGFLTIFVPVATVIAILIQKFLAVPVWKKFKSHKKFLKLHHQTP